MLLIICNHARVWVEVLNFLLIGLVLLLVLSLSWYAQAQASKCNNHHLAKHNNRESNILTSNLMLNNKILFNNKTLDSRAISSSTTTTTTRTTSIQRTSRNCLSNHQLIDSIVKAGRLELTLHNNTQGSYSRVKSNFYHECH